MGDETELRDDWTTPHPTRLPPGHALRDLILERHAEALTQRHPNYADPFSGLRVFTAGFLAQRGYCCESGCRHCPFVSGT